MKKSFTSFWRRNLGFFRLAIITNLEYRLNYFTDAVFQPVLSTLIEITLWVAVFASAATTEIGGFSRESYLIYVLWAAFIGRISATWMYEFRMIEEIEMGSVNTLLARPVSFFEYYLSQFMGYKLITSAISLTIPLAASAYFRLPLEYSRLPAALSLVIFQLFFIHTMSFCVACLAFNLNKVSSFTMAKNLALWLFSGELFPLDLLPTGWREVMIALPFANSVYVPVAYLTGRVGADILWQGFASTALGLFLFSLLARHLWMSGLRTYSGTGA